MGVNRKAKLLHFLRVDRASAAVSALSSPRSVSSTSSFSDDDGSSSSSFQGGSASSSPSRYSHSPPKSPWTHLPGVGLAGADDDDTTSRTGLIASLVKADGKVYSLAAAGDVLYTGTDSETVRVWRGRRELAGFRTGSGLVKAIVVAADGRIFTGHQDGKVRVWRRADDGDNPGAHRRVGTLPPLGDLLASAVNPSSYVRSPRGGRRRRQAVWLRHSDAVSSLSLDERAGVLYSASWDRTFKAWRVADGRCLESVPAHDDAVNAVAAAGFGGLVLTGSADGTVKVWWREAAAAGDRTTRHVLQRVLREGGVGDGGAAVTAIAACPEARAVYVGSSDGLVTCWRWGMDDVGGGEPTLAAVLAAGHGTGVLCLAVSGRVVVSGAADGTLCVWRRDGDDDDERAGHTTHTRLAVLAGHTGPVKCVAVAADDDDGDGDGYGDADGERRFVVYSGSLDGSVKVWRLSEDRALDPPPAAAVEAATAAPFMAALRESEAWMPRRPRTAQLPSSPVQTWAPEMNGVAAA